MVDEFQEGVFAPTLRAKMGRKRKGFDDAAVRALREREERERRLAAGFKLPMRSWTPEMKKRYNDEMARQADGRGAAE